MVSVVLAGRLVFDIILTLYFILIEEEKIVGQTILISTCFTLLSKLTCFINKIMCDGDLIDTAIKGEG